MNIGGVSLLGLGGYMSVGSGEVAVSRPEGVGWGLPSVKGSGALSAVWAEPHPKLNLVHFSRKIWHLVLVTVND